MKLLDEAALEQSHVVANNRMNRERVARGVNSYAKELGVDPVTFLSERLARNESASWLDLCCGRGRALIAAFEELSQFRSATLLLHGVDLVNAFDPAPANADERLCLTVASLHRWQPEHKYDLITCAHGLHYLGDKLGFLARAAGWLNKNGHLAANLDLANLRGADDPHFDRQVRRWFGQCGIKYDSRRHLLRADGPLLVESPFRFVGAHDAPGANYTGQEAVDSYYEEIR